tara:strand:+ start:6417 stop:6617 length:201 start_codon:yes stop_codon:yes gene_type:complete
MNQYEDYCLANAEKFTAVRGSKPSNRIRQEFCSIVAAKKFAATFGDGRTMIYAITSMGNNAHICNA